MLSSWLHLLALTAYLGAIIGLRAFVLPALSALASHEARLKLAAKSLKLYNPLQSGALGILVVTGAFQVTDLKAAYRGAFAREFGLMLGLKLGAAFILILASVYQSMGVGLRFVRRYEGGETITPADLETLGRRLRGSTALLLVLAAATAWLGLRLRG